MLTLEEARGQYRHMIHVRGTSVYDFYATTHKETGQQCCTITIREVRCQHCYNARIIVTQLLTNKQILDTKT
jgi:hypothetical protein